MKRRVAELILILYIVLAGVYSFYAAMTESGLGGYLMMWQFELIGSASIELTVAFCLLGLLLPVIPFLRHFPRLHPWFWRGMAKLPSDSSSSAAQASNGAETRRRPFSLGLMIALLLIPPLLGLGAQLYMSAKNERDASAVIGRLDLSDRARIVPPEATIVRASGKLQQQWAYILGKKQYGQTSGRTSYVPLTEPNWSSDQPVSVAAKFELQGGATSVWLEKGMLLGEVSRESLPPYVQKEWEKHGLHLAPNLIVLDHRWMRDGKVEPKYGDISIGLISPFTMGLFFGGVLFVTGIVSNLMFWLRNRRS